MKTPVLIAHGAGPKYVRVWCPYCHTHHYHPGAIEEFTNKHAHWMVAGCEPGRSPFGKTGYYLINSKSPYVGVPDEDLRPLAEAKCDRCSESVVAELLDKLWGAGGVVLPNGDGRIKVLIPESKVAISLVEEMRKNRA